MISFEQAFASLPSRPPAGEVFSLTINGSDPWSDPKQMLYAAGYNPDKWRFTGRVIQGIHTCEFKLETVRNCSNIDDVVKALRDRGEILEGQWRGTFALTYKLASIHDRLGIADPSWIDEYGDSHFPCMTLRQFYFHQADDIRRGGEGWLWLVKVR